MAKSQSRVSQSEDYPSAAYGWYVVVILTLAYMVSFIDRQIMALMVEPIRHDLNISDTQISLLLGLAFAIFYTILGIPIGRLADLYSRKVIIISGISIWCLMTAACGLARNYTQLFLTRVGVGVGEAALSPGALSMISDYFPKDTRVRAVSFYTMGISLGVGTAMILGGQVIEYVYSTPRLTLPVIGELYPWQTAFLVVGLPGLVVALLMLNIKEPMRRERLTFTSTHGAKSYHVPFATVVSFINKRRQMYGSHFVGLSVVAILAYGFYAWIPTMFIRTWGWTIGEVGMAYGLVTLISGPLAALLAAWTSEYLAKKHDDAHMRAAFIGVITGVVASVLAPLMPTPELSLIMLLPASTGTSMATAAGISALIIVTPNQIRAQASALFYFVINILGLTIGPTGIALLTDYIFQDDTALRYSIAIVALLSGVLASAVLLYNLPRYRLAYSESKDWSD